MKPSSYLVHRFGAGIVAAAVLLACDALLGIEPSERRDATPGQGGTPGDSGGTNAAGDTGVTTGGVAGTGDMPGNGGSGAGLGGASGGGGDSAGAGGSAGEGGDGGAPPEPPVPPEPGRSCDDITRTACSTSRPRLVLKCNGAAWETIDTCFGLQRCNPKQPQCEPLAQECQDPNEDLCTNDHAIDCEADPFAPPHRVCPYGCAHGACLTGAGDQLIVHTVLYDGGPRWPLAEQPIPVCFAGGEADDDLRSFTRSEVERSWGRYLNVSFAGWRTCESDDPAGVIVEFLDDCRGRIASDFHPGFPGSGGNVHVGICRTYRDAGDVRRVMDEPLARFVARHQFGHVLGLEEEFRGYPSTMVRGIRSSAVDSNVWADDVSALASDYGYKPESSIVHASGWCLDTTHETAQLSPCSATPAQRLHPFPDRIEIEGVGSCLSVEGNAVSGIAACSPPAAGALALRRARWSSPGHCVAPRTLPVVPGTAIETAPCAPVGDETQSWVFEIASIVDDRPQARIRFAAQNYCVTAPDPFSVTGDAPTLEPCSSASTLFELGPDGRVTLKIPEVESPFCLDWVGSDSVLYLRSSCTHPFTLTGPLETTDGHALAADPDDPGAGISIVELAPDELPTVNQVFDVWY